jgi:hypothetical protein
MNPHQNREAVEQVTLTQIFLNRIIFAKGQLKLPSTKPAAAQPKPKGSWIIRLAITRSLLEPLQGHGRRGTSYFGATMLNSLELFS